MVQPAEALLVTVDTNLLDSSGLRLLSTAVKGLPIELAIVTVSERESRRSFAEFHLLLEGGVWDESEWGRAVWGDPLRETWVLGEGRLDHVVLGSGLTADLLDSLLDVIAGGSFPKRGHRDHPTAGQRRQLRDAMILEAHARNRRDIFVTNDVKGFIRGDRREDLERLCRSTRILTADEFLDFCRDLNDE